MKQIPNPNPNLKKAEVARYANSRNSNPPIKDDVIKDMIEEETSDGESMKNFVLDTQDPLHLKNNEDGVTDSDKGDHVLMDQ